MGLRAVLRKLDVHDGRTFLRTIKSRALRDAARAFVWNNERVARVLALPVDLVANQLVWYEALSGDERTRQRSRRRRTRDSYAIDAEQRIAALRRSDRHYNYGIQTLLQTAAVLAWTTAECCAKDVWVACVSARPRCIPAEVLDPKVPIRLLVDPERGLSEEIGELVASGYSFKSTRGMREAYKMLFGTLLVPHVDFALKQADLYTLEQVRHLIVHRGGIVDAAFKARTSNRTRPGRPMVFSEEKLVRYANATTKLGKELLTFADGWLRTTKP